MVYVVHQGMTMLVSQACAKSLRPTPRPRPAGPMTRRVISVEPDLPPVIFQTMVGVETEVKPEDVYEPPPLKRVKKELEESREEDVEMGTGQPSVPTAPIQVVTAEGEGASTGFTSAGPSASSGLTGAGAPAKEEATEEFEPAPGGVTETRFIAETTAEEREDLEAQAALDAMATDIEVEELELEGPPEREKDVSDEPQPPLPPITLPVPAETPAPPKVFHVDIDDLPDLPDESEEEREAERQMEELKARAIKEAALPMPKRLKPSLKLRRRYADRLAAREDEIRRRLIAEELERAGASTGSTGAGASASTGFTSAGADASTGSTSADVKTEASGGSTGAGLEALPLTGAMQRRPPPPEALASGILHPSDCTLPMSSPSGVSSVMELLQFITEGHDFRTDAGLLGLCPEFEPNFNSYLYKHEEWFIKALRTPDIRGKPRILDLVSLDVVCAIPIRCSSRHAQDGASRFLSRYLRHAVGSHLQRLCA